MQSGPFGRNSDKSYTFTPLHKFRSLRDHPNENESTDGQRLLSGWPFQCRYYNPLIMDAAHLSTLIVEETRYADDSCAWLLEYISITEGQPHRRKLCVKDASELDTLSSMMHKSPLVVLHVEHKRWYFGKQRGTTTSISVDASTWITLLGTGEVLPSFLELLHSNNGGSLSITSYDERKPAAFHVAYKFERVAIYARFDFKTSQSFVLVLGQRPWCNLDRVEQLLKAKPEATIFHVVHALQSMVLDSAEKRRWELDYDIQALEARTGLTHRKHSEIGAEELERLTFSKDLNEAAHRLATFGRESAVARDNLKSFFSHLEQYSDACSNVDGNVDATAVRDLRSIAEFKLSLAQNQYDQIQVLRGRANMQLDITKTLIAGRDTQLSYRIAREAKRDSELMRRIALVTMIFLPATFAATFFSMVFFRITAAEEHASLEVDRHIWLYVVLTVPLTVVIGVWYFAWSKERSVMDTIRDMMRMRWIGRRPRGDKSCSGDGNMV